MTLSARSRQSNNLPSWLRRRIPLLGECTRIEGVVRKYKLHTVCREALCPNRAECYAKGKATFIILGNVCTRGCRFCSVRKGTPAHPDEREPENLAMAVKELGLGHVIVTSVTRDDLPDGGSGHYASVIRALKRIDPPPVVEVLIPDFKGDPKALESVLGERPEICAHNIETVKRLYPDLRSGAEYERSLTLLSRVKMIDKEVRTKSALILGLGETQGEVMDALRDLRRVDCDFVAVGQYLRPGKAQIPVEEYIQPERFTWLENEACKMGFREATAGPLVRSSYQENRLGIRHADGLSGLKNDARRSVL
jgi:lipoic acid synthetase